MSDIEEVTEMTMQALRELREGAIKAELAESIFNGTGKVIAAYKVRMNYEELKMYKPGMPVIAGLETTAPQKMITGVKAKAA